MHHGSRGRFVPILLVIAASLGCAVGPNPKRPATVADAAPSYVHGEVREAPPPEPGEWWKAFGDETVDALVAEALENNPDVLSAAARVVESRASLTAAGSSLWPQLALEGARSESENSMVLPGTGRMNIESTTYSADLSVSWELDLFGKLRRTRQAAWSEALAAEADRKAVRHAVIAAVVRGRIDVAALHERLRYAEATAESWRQTLRSVEHRYRMGVTGPLDLRLARDNMAAAEANVPSLRAALANARHALDVLTGRRPGTGEVPEVSLPSLPDLGPVPTGLPIDLLDRRPDLEAAEMRLAGATSRVGIAMASLFPGLRLTGSKGRRSDGLSGLTSPDNAVYATLVSLLQPIFQGGRLRAEVKAARAREDQAAAAYASAVLNALREVEDALVAEEAHRERLDHLGLRVEEARRAHCLAGDRYTTGVSGLLTLLETERRRNLAETEAISARADVWRARVALHLALGGDWGPNGGTEPREDRSGELP